MPRSSRARLGVFVGCSDQRDCHAERSDPVQLKSHVDQAGASLLDLISSTDPNCDNVAHGPIDKIYIDRLTSSV